MGNEERLPRNNQGEFLIQIVGVPQRQGKEFDMS
jgi:hypothetical protein